jgi:ABC-type polysaccharide/polyol phosphate export permease
MAIALWRYRTLLYQLTRREFKARYSSARLGVAWAVLNPLIMMGILSVVFSVFVRIDTGGVAYPLFVLNGLCLWQFFRATVSSITSCIVDDRDLMRRVPFPKALVPVSVGLSNLANLLLTFPFLFFLMAVYERSPHLTLLLVPLNLLLLALLALGIGLVTSVLTVFYRDMRYIIEPLLLVLFYASPILYPVNAVPASLRTVYGLNPLVGILSFQHDVMFVGSVGRLGLWGIAWAATFALILLGAWLYRRYSGIFVDML